MPVAAGRAVDMPLLGCAASNPRALARLAARLRLEARDARTWQIAALSGLLTWNITQLSLGASLVPSLLTLAAALAAQIVSMRIAGAPSIDLRSPLITGLSLSLLLRGDALWVMPAAAVVAIASKVLLRWCGKHLFNPAAFAIALMVAGGHGWVSPGQWGQSSLLVGAIAFLAIPVLTRAGRLDVSLAFLVAYAGLLVVRALWLGDPMAIPLHQVQNGALLLFAFFMISDPRTTPDARVARIGFAVVVAALAHWLIFAQQVRPGLYFALIAASPLVPLLDRLFRAPRFTWQPIGETTA